MPSVMAGDDMGFKGLSHRNALNFPFQTASFCTTQATSPL
jgi:hypothetical protein